MGNYKNIECSIVLQSKSLPFSMNSDKNYKQIIKPATQNEDFIITNGRFKQ